MIAKAYSFAIPTPPWIIWVVALVVVALIVSQARK